MHGPDPTMNTVVTCQSVNRTQSHPRPFPPREPQFGRGPPIECPFFIFPIFCGLWPARVWDLTCDCVFPPNALSAGEPLLAQPLGRPSFLTASPLFCKVAALLCFLCLLCCSDGARGFRQDVLDERENAEGREHGSAAQSIPKEHFPRLRSFYI